MSDFQKFITTCISSVTVFITLQEKTSLSAEYSVQINQVFQQTEKVPSCCANLIIF